MRGVDVEAQMLKMCITATGVLGIVHSAQLHFRTVREGGMMVRRGSRQKKPALWLASPSEGTGGPDDKSLETTNQVTSI
jgi:hypothetical protein